MILELIADICMKSAHQDCSKDSSGSTYPEVVTSMTVMDNGLTMATVDLDGHVHCFKPLLTKEQAVKILGGGYAGIYLALCNPPRDKK